MRIVIGSDHAGFELKEVIRPVLAELGHEVKDFGTFDTQPVDWPDIAFLVASAVAERKFDRGILIDGAGTAMGIVANKLPGVRAVTCWDAFTVQMAREHGDANILVLGGLNTGKGTVKNLVKQWLTTDFLGGRYQARIKKVELIEKQLFKK